MMSLSSVTLFLVALYFLPTIVAHSRAHRQKVPIALLNLFLGWTLLGWVAALVWAAARASDTDAARA